VSAAADGAPYQLHCIDPLQDDYEVIRPIVLCAETLAERRRHTGLERTTIGDKARRCSHDGRRGLVDQRAGHAGRKGHRSPEAVAAYMVYVKPLDPPMHDRALVRIVQRTFDSQPTPHTVKHCRARPASPVQLDMPLLALAECADASHARWTVGRMWAEGWHKKSIADWLQMARSHVYAILAAFARAGCAGLADQRAPPAPHLDPQLTLPFLTEVLDRQPAYPRAGRFRIQRLLEQQHGPDVPGAAPVGRALAMHRRVYGAPGTWQSARDEQDPATASRHLPDRPRYRHHLWCVDMRALGKLDGPWVSRLCILEGSSRTMLAGRASSPQDLPALLPLLSAALLTSGCPAGIVADHGAVCRAGDDVARLHALEIEPTSIARRQLWQHLLEAPCKVQRRLADFQCERAQTFAEMHTRHTAFVETFHTARPWAHQERPDGRRTPAEVWGGMRGRAREPARWRHWFGQVQFLRIVHTWGCISLQRCYMYAAAGLSRPHVSLGIAAGRLQSAYREPLIAQYRGAYARRQRRRHEGSHPTLSQTVFASPQLELIALDEAPWIKGQQRALLRRTPQQPSRGEQLLCAGFEISALLFLCCQAAG